jgi:hypothetical protein
VRWRWPWQAAWWRRDSEEPTRKVRVMLDQIDEFLSSRENGEDGSARKLWDVLTALRGPDDGDHSLKQRTTCVIRTEAFPRTSERSFNVGAEFSGGLIPFRAGCHQAKDFASHFTSHATHAAQALGLVL